MTNVVVFHHARGLTPGIQAFADELRAAGHTVTTPDLFDGKKFESIEDGVGYAQQIGFGNVIERGKVAANGLIQHVVYAGFSLGVMPAQMLAQTRPGAKGALLIDACLPFSEFGSAWPEGVPVQIHAMKDDEFFAEDAAAARELVESTSEAELFLYPGDKHLFADRSLPVYDAAAASLLMERVLAFLGAIES
jgi:dienelactone hydrolase